MLWTAERAWNHRPGDFVFPGDFVVVLLLNLCYNKLRSTRWCGEIGRRKGLKIPRWQHRTGSSPVTSTKNKRQKRFIAYKASKSKPFEGFHDEKWKPFSRRFIRVKASLRQDSNLQVRTFMSGALFRTEKMKKGATQNTIKGMS